MNLKDNIKNYMIQKGICKPYALKFARTETLEDVMTLGIDLQATPFICHLIDQNVLKSQELYEECERFINGGATFRLELTKDVSFTGRYYVKYNHKKVQVHTNTMLIIDCQDIDLFIPRFHAPIINVVGGSTVIINCEEHCGINISLYDETSTLLINNVHPTATIHVHRINCMNSNIDYDSNNANIVIHEPKIKDIYD